MNKKQKITMWSAIGVLVLMLLVPPWKYVYDVPYKIHREVPADYRWILEPPPEPFRRYIAGKGYEPGATVKIDVLRLVLPMCAIALVAAGLFVTFGWRKKA